MFIANLLGGATYIWELAPVDAVKTVIMIAIALGLMFLAIVKKFEPLLLLPLAFGILIANMPGVGLSAYDWYDQYGGLHSEKLAEAQAINPEIEVGRLGLMSFLYQGILWVIFPPLVFLCIGTMTDFGPLISRPTNALIGIGGQLGIFVAFGLSLFLFYIFGTVTGWIPEFADYDLKEAAVIGIVGSSDGPTSVFTATQLNKDLLASVAIAAFSYMALVPFIQPPIMKAMTTKKERMVEMPTPKPVSKRVKVIFPIALTIITLLLVPYAGLLIGMLMLGNLIRESGVAERYVKTLSTHLLNLLTLLVGLSIGTSATAEFFLRPVTLVIIGCGLLAFIFGTVGGVGMAKILCAVTKGKVNPLIGNSGVSAMPMAARISQKMGQKYNPQNHLLMHAMGPIVASTIGSAIIAGLFIQFFHG
ncbi:MAG: sodium ion-translocating decarboxylase subunit beta [Firmicutes bacterium]|nr:sodium ion-translocating decarboxylase subunit beta [Bacillota bacterium]